MSVSDDDDNGSSDAGSEENDIDETMEDIDDADQDGDGDVDMDEDDGDGDGDGDDDGDNDGDDGDDGEGDADGDGDGDGDGDADGDGDGDDNDDDDQGDNDDDDQEIESPTLNRLHARSSSRPLSVPQPNGLTTPTKSHMSKPIAEDVHTPTIRSPKTPRQTFTYSIPTRPKVRPEAITAATYDIVPTIAAPQSTSINAVTATPDMRWVFTGGSDGYIRKFNWLDTVNGKLMLTVAQRHPFVDSVIKAGVLLSYWENEDTTITTPVKNFEDSVPVSPVYSLAVHRQALWLLSGDETGSITLQSVRHGEGTKLHTMRSHKSAVSALDLGPDEQSFLSGGWDKNIFDWDLNTGQIKRTYVGSSGQITAIEVRPESSVPIPREDDEQGNESTTLSSNTMGGRLSSSNPLELPGNGSGDSSTLAADNSLQDAPGDFSDFESLFGGDDDHSPLNGSFGLGDDEEIDPFSRAADEQAQDSPGLEADAVAPTETKEPAPIEESTSSAPAEANEETSMPDAPPDPPPEPTVNVVDQSTPPSNLPAAVLSSEPQAPIVSESVFLSASFDGTVRIWDRRISEPVARMGPPRGTPPWAVSACWSPDGTKIYVGRRNSSVDEFSLLAGTSYRAPSRTFHFPDGSKAVSAVKAMPNGRHLICASFDILRLYDLQSDLANGQPGRQGHHSGAVPFLIVPGHRTGIISQLYIDPTCRFMISTGGDRGWEGRNTEVLLGYEIGVSP